MSSALSEDFRTWLHSGSPGADQALEFTTRFGGTIAQSIESAFNAGYSQAMADLQPVRDQLNTALGSADRLIGELKGPVQL